MDITSLIPRDKFDLSGIDALMSLSDEEISPVMGDLLIWLQDMNWPVAVRISEIAAKHIHTAVPHIIQILAGNDGMWKYNIISLLCSHPVSDDRLLSEMQRLAQHPTQDDISECVEEAAKRYLKITEV